MSKTNTKLKPDSRMRELAAQKAWHHTVQIRTLTNIGDNQIY